MPGNANLKMRARWEALADRDAMHFIHTGRERWDTGDFLATGRELVAEIMAWAGDDLPRQRMLDLGCGLGRTAIAFSEHFDRVDGVDISTSMIEQAEALGLPSNVHLNLIPGDRLDGFGDCTIDFVASLHMFQHVPDERVLDSYMSEIARVLTPAGKALLHFNTQTDRRLRRALLCLPDPLLPELHRRHIRCYRRDPVRLRALAAKSNLVTQKERYAQSSSHQFLLRRSPRAPAV